MQFLIKKYKFTKITNSIVHQVLLFKMGSVYHSDMTFKW